MNAFFALALLLQQESAETAFKKIEAGIERAKNIRVLYTLGPSGAPGSVSRGTMTLEGETKAKMSADLRGETGARIAIWTEFENSKIRSSVANHLVEAKGDGRAVRQNFNIYLSRLGIFAGAMFEHGFWSGASRGGAAQVSVDLKQMFSLKDFASVGEGSNNSRIISYNFSAAFKPMPFTWAKIWYDPRNYRLLRREMCWADQGKEEILVEEYEVQLDDDKGAGGAKPGPVRSDAEADVLFIQAKVQVANEHLQEGRKQKAIDVLEDLALSFPKHPLYPEIKRLLEEAKKK